MRSAETVAGVFGDMPPVAWGMVMLSEVPGQEGRRPVGRGGFVRWEGQRCRVVHRRRVSALAFPRTCEFELFLEATDGNAEIGYVAENEVEPDDEKAGEEQP
jgi:hypothetical protein